jgi:hypothetical protein
MKTRFFTNDTSPAEGGWAGGLKAQRYKGTEAQREKKRGSRRTEKGEAVFGFNNK